MLPAALRLRPVSGVSVRRFDPPGKRSQTHARHTLAVPAQDNTASFGVSTLLRRRRRHEVPTVKGDVGAANKAAIQLVRHRLRHVDELMSSRSAEVKSSRISCSCRMRSDATSRGR